jgi:uridine kinase
MQLIVISGPSGSGKTTLSKRILKKIKNGIILNTDNYYRTGILSQILSRTLTSYFDRKISFNFGLFKRDLEFIVKNGFSDFYYKYNFKSKSIKKVYQNTKNIRFLIIEGIFGQEILKTLSKENCLLIKLKANKQTCLNRVIKRDFLERGKSKELAKRDFIKAWELFHKNKKKCNSRNYFNTIVIRKKSDIDLLLKKIINIVN